MKRLILFFGLIFAISSVFAQNEKLYDPSIKATVTPELTRSFSQYRFKSTSDIIDLTFEGIGDFLSVGNYYNGGAGGNYGITWTDNSYSLVSSDHGGSGNFCNNSTPPTCLFFVGGAGSTMTVAGGFTTGFSFYYSSSNQITITVWDGPNGTGNTLATQSYPANYNTSVGAQFTCTCPSGWCHWDPVGVTFIGTAQSVTFGGAANQCAFDDITLGASSPVTLPTVVTTAATSLTANGATLNGTVNANGTNTTVTFEYGLTTAYGNTVTATESPVTGSTVTSVSAPVAGLAPNTVYHFRVVGTNISGTSNGGDLTFTTPCPPIDAAGTITGPAQVCPNSTGVVYSISVLTGATGYTWSVPAGATITAGGNTTSITVTFGTTSGNVSVFGTNPCTTGTARSLAVTVLNPLVVGSISADQTICYNTTPAGLIGVAPTGGNTPYTYQWYYSTDNSTFNYIAGATSLNYQPGALTATTYYRLNQSSASGCGTVTTNAVTITVYPHMSVPTLTGPDQACQQGNPGIYTTDPGMINYQWTASAGGIFVTGTAMSEVRVVWLTAGVHTLSVTYTTPAGCVPQTAGTKNVTVNAQPHPTIDGNNSTCLLGVKHIYTTESGMSNYVWAVPGSAGTIVSGQGTHEVEVMWFLEGDYWISVSYANPSGCSPVTATVAGILLRPIPGNAGPVTGLTTSCGPVYQVEYRVDRIPGADTYVWSVPEGAMITSGRGSWSIMVDYPTVPVSGSVSVYPMNACARGESSPPLEIRLFAVPETPLIRLEGRTLISSSESGNQWYRAQGAISGATGQTYSPVESGEYWVQVTSENCTSQPSNTLHYIGVGIDNLVLSRFEIYPVPNDGQFTISFATESVHKSRVQIMNSMGTTIYEWDGVSGIGGTVKEVDLRSAAKGLYLVVLSTGQQREIRKIMIL